MSLLRRRATFDCGFPTTHKANDSVAPAPPSAPQIHHRSCPLVAITIMEDNRKVFVAVRVRPKLDSAMNATHAAERYHPEAATRIGEDGLRITEGPAKGKDSKTNMFTFDAVFDKDSSQDEVYEATTLELVDRVLCGCNATVITYGQTGSGKTFTVLGAVNTNPLMHDVVVPETGLFLRAIRDMLHYRDKHADTHNVAITLSVVEVYLDTVRDLLGRDATAAIRLSVDNDTVTIPDLTVKTIGSLRDAVAVYKAATARRVSRATDSNDTSSRSHALFIVDFYQQAVSQAGDDATSVDEFIAARDKALTKPGLALQAAQALAATFPPGSVASQLPPGSLVFPVMTKGRPPASCGRLVLTDLAGSEKMKTVNAKGDALEEMKKINGSLTCLGNVVHALFEGAKHVPYRDTKLTLILRNSFASPDARVCLIANVSPTALSFDETLSTLFFANKVKAMKAPVAGGGDALKLESDTLALLRTVDELAGDLRIVRAAQPDDLPPTLPACRLYARDGATPGRASTNVQPVSPIRFSDQPLKRRPTANAMRC